MTRQVLCYGDSNTWGCVPLERAGSPTRFGPDERWPGVMRRELGSRWWVVEDGLNGRTTVLDDEFEPFRNGRDLLLPALLTHHPLDVVVIMLGLNDLKRQFDASPADVADGAGQLVDIVQRSSCGQRGAAPAVLLVCPPPIGRLTHFAELFGGAAEKSLELASAFRAIAQLRACAFLDAGAYVSCSDTDGVHLDRQAHDELGTAVAIAVRSLVATGSPT